MTRGPHARLRRLRLRLGRMACQIFPLSARSPAIYLPTMARLIARTLTLARPAAPGSSLQPHRALSDKVELIEIDLSEESASSTSSGDSAEEPMGMGRLNDAIRGVIVRRAAPEWLPFVPGGSYWVPPMRRPLGVSDLVGTVVYNARAAVDTAEMARSTMVKAAMTKEEAMCFTTQRGWPSEAYFVQGKVWHPVKKSRKNAKTDDEES